MELFKLPFVTDLKIVLIVIDNIDADIIQIINKSFEQLNPNNKTDIMENNKMQYLLCKYNNFDNAKISEFVNKLIKFKILNFKVYLFYFDINLFYPSINVTKIFLKNEKLKNNSKKYLSMTLFFNNKKEFTNIFNKFMQENIKNGNKIIKQQTISKNKYIEFKNFQDFNIKISKILNLFSIFGNIKYIYYNFYNSTIFIEYTDKYEAERLMNNIKLLVYKDIKFDIDYSKTNIKNQYFFKLIKQIKIENKINRFNSKIKIKYNSPNNVLNISNINYGLKLFKLYKIIKNIADPWVLRFNFIKNNKTKMCWLKFKNIQDSINVLIDLNNKIIDKRKLKIAFSFNRLI